MYYYSIKKSFLIAVLSVIPFLCEAQEDDLLQELDSLNQNKTYRFHQNFLRLW